MYIICMVPPSPKIYRIGASSYASRSVNAFCQVSQYGSVIARYLTGTMSAGHSWDYGGDGPVYTNQAANTSDSIRVIANHNLSYVMNNIAASLSKFALDVTGNAVKVLFGSLRHTYLCGGNG
jgi:hypothetical protein